MARSRVIEAGSPRQGRRVRATSAQTRQWFLEQLQPDRARYNLQQVVALDGPLKRGAVQVALDALVQRQECLRTSLSVSDGEVEQLVHPPDPVPVAFRDCSHLKAPDEAAAWLATEQLATPFDLTNGPLFRAMLIRLADERHQLALTLHHVISDAWSNHVLFEELRMLYEAATENRISTVPELLVQYGDYAEWEFEQAQTTAMAEHLDYWARQLRGAPEAIPLPAAVTRDASSPHRGATERIPLPRELMDSLQGLGTQHGASLYMMLLVAFALTLDAYSGESEMVIGSLIANRELPDTAQLIGFFVNTVALRVDLRDDPHLNLLIERVRRVATEAYAHQAAPFDRVLQRVAPSRDPRAQTFTSVMFQLADSGMREAHAGELRLTAAKVASHPAPVDLALSVMKEADGYIAYWDFDAGRLDAGLVQRMHRNFVRACEAITVAGDDPISRLALVAPEEAARLRDWAGDPLPRRDQAHVLDTWDATVRSRHEGVAATAGRDVLTYREVDEWANGIAAHLRAFGVGPEDRVAVMLTSGVALPPAIIGVLKTGATFVVVDPALPASRKRFILTDAEVRVVVHAESAQPEALDGLPLRLLAAETARTADSLAVPVPMRADMQGAAYMIYTSGSTGEPKGVLVTHVGLSSMLRAQREVFALMAGDVVLQYAPWSFDAAIFELWLALGAGATVDFLPDGIPALGDDLELHIRERDITVLTLTPAVLAGIDAANCSNVRIVNSVGDVCRAPTAAAWCRAGVRFFNLYGPTETTIWATVEEVLAPEAVETARVPIGVPVPGATAHVLDRHGRLAPIDTTGSLMIGGVGVSRGYAGKGALTASAFRPDPYANAPGSRMYATGDLARWNADGKLELLGRTDHQVKIRGVRIELEEVQVALLKVEEVTEAIAMTEPDANGEPQLVAYIETNADLSAKEVRRRVADWLPRLLIPTVIHISRRLPRTASGKVDRQALVSTPAGTDALQSSTTGTEAAIARIWSKVLGQPDVKQSDSFFELGGHSLLAMRLVSRVQDDLGVVVPVRTLFEAPRLDEFAREVDRLASDDHERPPRVDS